jgi:hypothetical protein
MAGKKTRCVERSAALGTQFPLTPALSPGEREQRRQSLDISTPANFAQALATVLPLPEGEGRREGEDDARQIAAPDASILSFRR